MVDFDRSLLGRLFETANPVEITSEMIARFCAMIGETNPVYTNLEEKAPIAPPAFVATFRALERIFSTIFLNTSRDSRLAWMSSLSSRSERATPSPSALHSRKAIPRPDEAAR